MGKISSPPPKQKLKQRGWNDHCSCRGDDNSSRGRRFWGREAMGDFESESCQGELLPVMLLTCWCCTCTREEKMVVPGSTQKTLKIGLYKMKIVCQPPFCRFHVTFWRVNECKWYKMHQNALKRTRLSSLKKNIPTYTNYTWISMSDQIHSGFTSLVNVSIPPHSGISCWGTSRTAA